MELLDSDIHFPKDDILMRNLKAITTPICKLAIYPQTKVSEIRGTAVETPKLPASDGVRASGPIGNKWFKSVHDWMRAR